MADKIETAVYKMAADTSQFVGPMQASAKSVDAVTASAERLVIVEEKATRVTRARVDMVEKEAMKLSDRARSEAAYAETVRKMAIAEKEGISSAQRRGEVIDMAAEKLKRQIAALEAAEKAQRANNQTTTDNAAAAAAVVGGIDKEIGALNELNKKLKDLATVRQSGAITLQEEVRLANLARDAYRNQVGAIASQEAAMRKSSTVTGLARHEMINLSRQLQDVGVSLSGGQSPFRVLVEQGSQIADIFASSRTTVKEFFTSIATGIRGLGPGVVFGGIIAGITALVAGGAAAALSWGSARSDVEKALLGIGRASGVTVNQIDNIAKSSAAAFGLSISEAREFTSILAATGRVGAAELERLAMAGKNLSIMLGTDSTEAAKTLASVFRGDLGAGVEQLNAKIGGYDAATIQLVKSLQAQHRTMEAVKIITMGVTEATVNAGQAATTSANFWTFFGNKVSNAWDKIGEAIARTTGLGLKLGLDEQVENAKRALSELERLKATGGSTSARRAGGADEEAIRRAREELERATKAQKEFNEEQIRAQRIQASRAGAAAVERALPEIAQFRDLQNEARGAAELIRKVQDEISALGHSPFLEAMGVSFQQLQLAAARTAEALSTALTPAARLTQEFELSKKAITARTAEERIALAGQQMALQTAGQKLTAEERATAVVRAQVLEATKLRQAHLDAVEALEGQLSVAQALTGAAKLRAQEEATTNDLIRQGRDQEEAATEAALQRQIAQEGINRSIQEQVLSLQQQTELIYARLAGDEASVRAAQAYENAMRAGADATHAAALAAAILENEVAKAAENAGRFSKSMSQAGTGFHARSGMSIQWTGEPGSMVHSNVAGGPVVGSAGMSTAFDLSLGMFAEFKAAAAKSAEAQQKAADAAAEAADAQRQAGEAATRAAEEQAAAAKAAREAHITALDEAIADIVATKLLGGMTPQQVNAMIEAGQIPFGTASQRFQTQLELYKRAGMSPAQTAADIRAGIIGEGARPSELLEALDSLADAVDSNTDAQLGLSEFYTQQGDRLLGYRGYNVQKGSLGSAGNIPGGPISGADVPDLPGAGGMGGVINQPGVPGDPVYSTAPTIMIRVVNGQYLRGYYNQSGQWVTIEILTFSGARKVHHMAEGGVVDRPTFGMMGEAGPEAFVPLRHGAIPVKLIGNAANNNNKGPATVVNINAPLVHFAAEPTRDDVRETAFQAGQMFRRLAFAG